MPMRLNAYLARAGVASRRGADELIKAGRVTVNGEPGELNTFVGPSDVVELDGERLQPQELAYVLLHKPAGVVTTAHDPQGRRTVVELVGHPAAQLHRSRYAGLSVEGLEPGAWRELEPFEVGQLRTMPGPGPAQAGRRTFGSSL